MCVCMCGVRVTAYGFMYVRIYVCMNARMYLTMYMRVRTYMRMYECM